MSDPAWQQSRFLKACRREPVDRTPVWIMRQAGRYLPEYMAVRSRVTFLELCERPELAAQVTLDAQRLLGVDAAILFADLLPMLRPMGLDLEYAQGEGPVIHNPVRTASDVDRLRPLENIDDLGFTFDAVRLIRRDLPADIPLLGFSGLPFTLASYAIEGAGSKNYAATKRMMYADPSAWDRIMSVLADSIIRYVNAQFAAGCQAAQLFDSWVGCLGVDDYRRYVFPYVKHVFDGLTPGHPAIHFTTGNPALLPLVAEAGGSVLGFDWRVNLRQAWDAICPQRSVQGNLDPVRVYDRDSMRDAAAELLRSVSGRAGHIFNLGHGVFPDHPAENVKDLVRFVHDFQPA